jgi:hypothetical protein
MQQQDQNTVTSLHNPCAYDLRAGCPIFPTGKWRARVLESALEWSNSQFTDHVPVQEAVILCSFF